MQRKKILRLLDNIFKKGERIMEVVFISHPFSGDAEENKRKAKNLSLRLNVKGKVVINPLDLFSFFDDELRKEIMEICFRLIDMVDIVYFYNYGKLSGGQKEELEYTKKIGKNYKVVDMTWLKK